MGPTRITHGPQAERPVDMHPRTALARPFDDLGERIERAGVDFAGLSADDDRPLNVGKFRGNHAALIVGRNAYHSITAKTDERQRLQQRRVGLLASDNGQLWGAEQPAGRHVPPGRSELLVAACSKAGRVGDGCTRDESGLRRRR